jgi:hypothetical protein
MPFTTVPGAKLGAVAAALAQAFEGIDGVAILDHDPLAGEIASPCIAVGELEIDRTELGDPERRLGAKDWTAVWTVRLYVRLDSGAAPAWATARSLLGQMIAALDFDPVLGGEVEEARLLSSSLGPNEADLERVPQLVGECSVGTDFLMSNP